jgi:hypothetical protein
MGPWRRPLTAGAGPRRDAVADQDLADALRAEASSEMDAKKWD